MIDTNRTLPTDTYYRGYRLAVYPDGHTFVYWEAEKIDIFKTRAQAEAQIDKWLNAR